MNNPTDWYAQLCENDEDHPKATGADLLQTVKTELRDLRPLLCQKNSSYLLDSILNSSDFGSVHLLLVQLLQNMSAYGEPLYEADSNRLTAKGMLLFYDKPASVLCNFEPAKASVLAALHCKPQSDTALSKREFLVWKLTDGIQTDKTPQDAVNDALAQYGYSALRPDEATDKLCLNLLRHEAELCAQLSVLATGAKHALYRVLKWENERELAQANSNEQTMPM